MWDSWEDWDGCTKSKADEFRETFVEFLLHNLIINFKNVSTKDITIIIDNVNLDLIEEWDDFKLVE